MWATLQTSSANLRVSETLCSETLWRGNGCFVFALQIKEPWRQRRAFSVELLTFEIVSLPPYQAGLLLVS